MQRRTTRYVQEDVSTEPRSSRSNKNKYLYDEIDSQIGYGKMESLTNTNKTQEVLPVKKRSDKKQNTEQEDNASLEPKVYDINSVLEEAKKRRNIPEEVEKKRNLQNAEYSILDDLNKKYISKKEKLDEELEEQGIRELIDTITSRNLPKDLLEKAKEDDDKDLMSDLMATNTLSVGEDINLEEEIAKEILAKKEEQDDTVDEIKTEDGRLVNSFYTRSMDLTEHDFDIGEDGYEEHKNKTKMIVLIVLILIVVLATVGLIVLRKMGII